MRDGSEKPFDGTYMHSTLGLDYLGLTRGVMCGEYDGERTFCFLRFDDISDLAAATVVKGWRPLRGHELKFLRILLDLPQKDLAAAIGTTRATIARWEENWTHKPGSDGLVPEDKNLPVWGDRAVRMHVAAAIGLSDMSRLLTLKGFGEREDGQRSIVLDYDGEGWSLAYNTFGPSEDVSLQDPRLGRRLVLRMLTGDPFGDDIPEVARMECLSLREAAASAAGIAKRQKLERWHLVDYHGKIMAHDDPEIRSSKMFPKTEVPDGNETGNSVVAPL